MLELILFIISFVFLVLGVIGAIIPILPGPLLTYLAFLIIYLFTDIEFITIELITYTEYPPKEAKRIARLKTKINILALMLSFNLLLPVAIKSPPDICCVRPNLLLNLYVPY